MNFRTSEWRRFIPVAKSGEDMQKLEAVLEAKGITKDDLVLIFRCLAVNPGCEGMFE